MRLKKEDFVTKRPCISSVSTCAANPIQVEKITAEMIVDCAKQIKDIRQSEIDTFNTIVNVFNEKNDLLKECLFFLSAFVDDDYCYNLKTRIENHLGIKYNKKGANR